VSASIVSRKGPRWVSTVIALADTEAIVPASVLAVSAPGAPANADRRPSAA
jgi:hypothetical protein